MLRRAAVLTAITVAGWASVACTSTSTLRVTDAWARPTAGAQTTGAVYFVLDGGSRDDDLLAASVSPAIAGSAELHETMTTAGDQMEMGPIPAVHLPAGGSVRFTPGGRHVMLVGLARPLERGRRFSLALRFRRAGVVRASVHVVDRT